MAFHDAALARYHGLPAWAQQTLEVLLVLVAGWIAVRILTRLLVQAVDRGHMLDATIRAFLRRLIKTAGYTLLAIVVLTMLGVDLAALLGGLAIGGFIVGFALKDALGNLAAGVMLLLYRPFNVGDFVEIDGYLGTVTDLGISLTVVRRVDGVIVTLPNGSVLGGPIVNFTRAENRRATVTVSIEQDDDLPTALRVLNEALDAQTNILRDPAPEVVVTNLTEDGIDIEIRAWSKAADFGPVINGLRPLARDALQRAGLRMARRELVVHQATAPGA